MIFRLIVAFTILFFGYIFCLAYTDLLNKDDHYTGLSRVMLVLARFVIGFFAILFSLELIFQNV